MKMSAEISELAKSLALFQGEVKQPEKDGVNPHFKSKFVTLDNIVKAIHAVAPAHGLSFVQVPVSNDQGVGVSTVIFHSSGQFLEFEPFILPLEKKTAQGAGSGISYAKRYSLAAAFGLVSDEDDDGNEATKNAVAQITPQQVGTLKMRAGEFAEIRGKSVQEVYKAVNLTERGIEKLTAREADTIIGNITKWISKAKEEAGVGA